MRRPTLALFSLLLTGTTFAATALATPPVGNPRRVICISAGNDGFLSQCEGYYRGLPPKGTEANDIQVGGALDACMGRVRKGDQLIVVAHGSPGQFLWSNAKGNPDTPYNGYGDGTNGTFPVPANLRGTNSVTATLMSCHSNVDPAGAPVSVVQSLRNVMNGGGGANNTVSGFDHGVNSTIGFRVNSQNAAQRQAAEANLDANDGWMDNPPSNRPGATHTDRAAAEAQLAGKPAFAGKNLTVTVTYAAPVAKTEGIATAGALGLHCEGNIHHPGVVFGPGVPGPGGVALGVLSLLLAVGSVMVMWRRTPARA
jgi:hypothetical protein